MCQLWQESGAGVAGLPILCDSAWGKCPIVILVSLAIFASVLMALYLRWQAQETFFTGKEVCPRCHHAVQAGYLICPFCLQPLRHPCTSCGRPIEGNWTVCPFCGRSVERVEQPKELNSYKLSEL